MTTPYKEEREKCWSARDIYWQCLDTNNNKSDKCVKFRKEYEKFCSKQWVKHFDRKRNYEEFKSNLNEIGWEMPSKDSDKNK